MPTEHSSAGDPARTLQLLWRKPDAADSRRGPRQGLSVERVAAAAIALADRDGDQPASPGPGPPDVMETGPAPGGPPLSH